MRTQIQRPGRERGSNPLVIVGIGCAALAGLCAVALVIGAIFLLPRLPNLAAQVAGLQPQGDTLAVVATTFPTPIPTVALENATVPQQVTIDLGQYGAQNVDPAAGGYEVAVGSVNGQNAMTARFDEAALLDLCRQRTNVCTPEGNGQFRNARFDLRPGGAVVYADATIPQLGNIQQTIGIALRLDSTGTRFEFAGVDINGQLFDVPPGELAVLAEQLEREGNALLDQLSVNAGVGQFTLQQVTIDDQAVTLLLS